MKKKSLLKIVSSLSENTAMNLVDVVKKGGNISELSSEVKLNDHYTMKYPLYSKLDCKLSF